MVDRGSLIIGGGLTMPTYPMHPGHPIRRSNQSRGNRAPFVTQGDDKKKSGDEKEGDND